MKTLYQKTALLLLLCLMISATGHVWAQNAYQVSGVVVDEQGLPLPGVNISNKANIKSGTISDMDGNFTVKNLSGKVTLQFTYMGYSKNEYQTSKAVSNLKITMTPDAESIDEVVVVGMGTQRKVSVVGAITSVKPDLLRAPSTSVSNMLAGVVPGVIAVARSGEPGQDVSEFWIRGISTFGANSSALVLIDGVEGRINDIDPSDIESFSILKDASATAIYGVRGANGVVLITTKSGEQGRAKITWRSSASLSYSPRMPEYLGAYDYAMLANEARAVSDMTPLYTPTELEIIKNQLDPDLYPDVNWQDEILKDFTFNHQHYLNVSGGGKVARYFVSVAGAFKDAVFNQDKINKYDTNVNWAKYNFRAKTDINLTSSTVMSLSLDGALIDEQAPGWGDNQQLWGSQVNLTPLSVPVRYSTGVLPAYGSQGWLISPYILLNMTGYKKNNRTSMGVQFNLSQDFGKWIKGLRANGTFAYNNNNTHNTQRKKQPNAYKAFGRYNDGSLMLQRTISETPLSFTKSAEADRKYFFAGMLDYSRIFNKVHRVGATARYEMQSMESTAANDEIAAIPTRYQSLSARATYSYDDTYLIEGNIGYTGSENFQPGKQFGFFPAVALGWIPTQYKFMQENLGFLNHLKFRASYGEVGNDRIGGRRFPYQTLINTGAGGGWGFGGLSEGQVGADNLHWEVAKKYNLGVDFQFFNNLFGGTFDVFKDTRDNIFQERVMIPVETGLVNNPFTNVGRMRSSGVDGNIYFTPELGDNHAITFRANMTYATNEVVHWDENVQKYPYKYRTGYSLNQQQGLIAMGLFKDEEEIKSSPKQQYGIVRPGDIRYKDVNGDGMVNNDDIVRIGRSDVPQLQYGFAVEYRYKNWTFSTLFVGHARVNYFLGGSGYYPFVNGETGNILSIANNQKDRWTPAWYSGDPSTENPDARFPRMTYGNGDTSKINNYQTSTFWMADGSFVRWQNLDISYRFNSNKYFQKAGISGLTLQFVGQNLATFDSVKLWDPGQASGNGAAYPLQRTFSLQLTATF